MALKPAKDRGHWIILMWISRGEKRKSNPESNLVEIGRSPNEKNS
jgi:hypothetical protein